MRKAFTFILFTLASFTVLAQSPKSINERSLGLNYFGELGFRPGLEVDYGISLFKREKENSKRLIEKQLNLRPSLAFYHYANYSNNSLLALKLNYQFKFHSKKTEKYLFVEPFIKAGYLRYFLIGDVFETQNNSLKEVRFKSSNSIVLGSGLDVGGYLSKRFDWLVGFDYFAESTEDKLILHRFVAKLGTRIKLKSK